ncbi:hypothetical protein MKX08_008330 [Trichoderma sp. CBMAI-0020]|nr:hypothetical protein MKX08_008330 [Trichoderma sp. CBMAI-0020]
MSPAYFCACPVVEPGDACKRPQELSVVVGAFVMIQDGDKAPGFLQRGAGLIFRKKIGTVQKFLNEVLRTQRFAEQLSLVSGFPPLVINLPGGVAAAIVLVFQSLNKIRRSDGRRLVDLFHVWTIAVYVLQASPEYVHLSKAELWSLQVAGAGRFSGVLEISYFFPDLFDLAVQLFPAVILPDGIYQGRRSKHGAITCGEQLGECRLAASRGRSPAQGVDGIAAGLTPAARSRSGSGKNGPHHLDICRQPHRFSRGAERFVAVN